MAGKKLGASKGKEKESNVTVTAGHGWKQSKCSEANLQALVDDWHSAIGDKRSYERADEFVLFQYFVEQGLALPTSDFFFMVFFSTTKSNSII
jgi:hypothetical protein